MAFTFTFVVACVVVGLVDSADWDYHNEFGKGGVQKWNSIDARCNGKRQSPIDIDTKSSIYHSELKPLVLSQYSSAQNLKYLGKNGGHTISVDISTDNNQSVPMHLKFNDRIYRMDSFHFHWGDKNTIGSEHTKDGVQYAAEIHILHYDTMYTSLSEAIKVPGGVVAFGHFIEVDDTATPNTNIEALLSQFTALKYKGSSKNLKPFAMKDIIPRNSIYYYHYEGSLTVPPCVETVQWVVNRDHIIIPSRLMTHFRSVDFRKQGETSKPMVNNYRPVTKLNNRHIYRSFESSARSLVVNFCFISSIMSAAHALLH